VLEVAGLQDQSKRLTGELPLGIKQRLALGCAVLHEPPILFLDEPTSGVDPLSRRRFWDLINHLTDHGTTVFVSTHYMEEAEYCHRLALMNRGKLIALDSPSALRRSSDDPLYELNTDDSLRTVKLLQDSADLLEVAMYGRSVHLTVKNEEQATQEVRARLEDEGIRVLAMRRIQPSLEDAFVAKVREAGGAPVD
jgi:ABC-2 type transport system ATP-binding protein